MKAYSEDLRRKIVDAIGRGMPKAEAARTFGIGISTVKRYATKARRGEPLQPGKAPGKRPKIDERVGKLSRRGPPGAPVRHPKGALRVRASRKWGFGEPLYHVPRHSQDRLHPQKGGQAPRSETSS